MAEKRQAESSNGGTLIKRAKSDTQDNSQSLINLSDQRSGTRNAIVGTVRAFSFLFFVFYFINTKQPAS